MANPEHLQILKQGVDTWNAWRERNRDIRPDLSEANLRNANLKSANLSEADLSGANLSHAALHAANLKHANLSHAGLSGAGLGDTDLRSTDLRSANLSHTNLGDANLSGADLSEADLSHASFIRTNFTRTNLTGADVSEVHLEDTVFGDTNLTAVRGLETCNHWSPSTLDHHTLAQSGPLPLAFLRGCGLPDALINYLPSLLNQPFQFYSCFISHASKDHAFAERLYADLQNKGVRCWFAPEDMKIGDRLRPRIDETIRVYDKLLLVLSKTSVASQWVEQEVETALARERQQGTTILFPVRIDDTVMTLETGWPALIRNTRHIGDFRRWKTHDVYQKAFDRLLRDLKAAEKQPEGSRPVG
jgi:TIR domain-containing protein/pentapeptide repeat protein